MTDADVEYREIRYEVEDPVATITLSRPEAMNAWTEVMGREVKHAWARAEADPAVVGIVLTGEGRGFCAGADLTGLSVLSEGGEFGAADGSSLPKVDVPAPPSELEGTYFWFMSGRKPVIAAINGAVAGMAVPIALGCDVRFMAEDAPLVTAFAQRGLIAEWGLSWLLTRLAGPGAAMDLLLSSRKVLGTECEQLGIVNKALPRDQVLEHAKDYVRQLAQRSSPWSMSVMKRQVWIDLHRALNEAEAESQRLMHQSFQQDFKEGVQSFLQKRPPAFPRLGSQR